MTKLEMYQFNVNRRYGAKQQEALSQLAYHKYAMNNGGSRALASFLIREGHGLTGPTGMYGITALDRWKDRTKGFVGLDIVLKFGEAILKAMPRLRVLYDGPAWEINFKSYFWEIDSLRAKDPAVQKIMVDELVEDFQYVMKKKKQQQCRPWALGSLILKEVRMRKEPWVRIESIFHFQPTVVGTVQCPQPRTLHGDWRRWVEDQDRWTRSV